MKREFWFSGQSLVELLIAIGVGAILFVGTAALVAPSLQINKVSSQQLVGTALGQELLDNVRVWSEGNWHSVLSLATGTTNAYYLIASSSPFIATSGIESILVSTTTFTRSFYLGDVYRDSNGNVTSTAAGNFYDPSTKQVTVSYDWTHGATTTMVAYITRNHTAVLSQSDWSGGSGLSGPVTSAGNRFYDETGIDYLDNVGSIFAQTASTSQYSLGSVLLVADTYNNRVEEFNTSGTYESKFGTSGTGTGQFNDPFGIVIDTNSNIWVSDTNNNRVEEFSATGTYENQFGSIGSGNGQFSGVYGLAIDTSGNIWAVDSNNNRIEEFSATGTYENQFGSLGSGNGDLDFPYGIGIDSGNNIWVADTSNNRVEEFSATGTYENQFGSLGSGNGDLHFPYSMAFDSGGNIWVVDYGNNRIEEFSATGTYEGQFGSSGSGNGYLSSPTGITIDSGGNIWVADTYNNRVEEFNTSGTYENKFGSHGSSNGDFIDPSAIAFPPPALPATEPTGTISSSTGQHWAWNDALGWIDFYNNNNVLVGSAGLQGYASSTAGPISLDCATSPSGNVCNNGGGSSSAYQVLNDGSGDLSGWAWNDAIGWISFCGGQNTANCPGTTNYETTIDSNGNFQGWAWNDNVGWISFNCDNNGGCGTSYEVKTTWTPPTASSTGQLTSAIFDTGDASGAQFNSILWRGTQSSGSTVQFQLAVSNSSSGPWNYDGPDGTSNTYYTPTGPGSAVSLSDTQFDNYRYFRYRIFITYANGSSSRVNNVVVNWSP